MVAIFYGSAMAAQAPDTSLVTGPSFAPVLAPNIIVTPTGGAQQKLGDALSPQGINLTGANASGANVTAAGGSTSRSLSAWLGDTVNALGQGVTGNGSTDDQPNLLTAAGLAQSTGNTLVIPTPTSSYLLNSDWMPAAGDLSVYVSPGVTFTGTGLVRQDNQIPYMAYPAYSPQLRSQTFGSYFAPGRYANILMNANVAINNGAGNTVAVFAEGVSQLSGTHTWGTNPVCVTVVTGANCIGEEIDVWAEQGPSGALGGYGLLVMMTGHANGLNAVTIGANAAVSKWQNGIVFNTAGGGGPMVINALIETGVFTGTVGEGMYMQGRYSGWEMNWPSFTVGATPVTPTARVKILAGTGSGATLSVIPNDGGSTVNEGLSVTALGNGVLSFGNGDGIDFQVQDGGASTINSGYVKGGATGVGVTYGCGVSGDANVNCTFSPRGTGSFTIQNTGGGAMAQFTAPASTVSRFQFNAAASGSTLFLGVGGTATGINIQQSAGSILQFGSTGSWSANGSVATTMTSLGPTGAHTTVQEWFTVTSATGVRYIPAY